MANRIRTPFSTGHVSVPATIHTEKLPLGTYVKITGDATVDLIAAEDEVPVGFVMVSTKAADKKGTVQTRYQYLVDAECKGAIAAADRVKIGDTDGGVQTFKKWISGTDNPSLIVGICWVGAADDAVGTFLIF
jgi:hypothetical protein